MKQYIPLIGATVGLFGALALIAAGALVIAKRTETSSLFVEDRMGFVVAKLVFAFFLIAVGLYLTMIAISRLTTLEP